MLFTHTNDTRAGNYYFVEIRQIQKDEMRFIGSGKYASTFIYEFSDQFGSGRIGFEDRGFELQVFTSGDRKSVV